MAYEPELHAHQEWLGYLQPVGLVVSPHALIEGQAFINKNVIADHARFLECVAEVHVVGSDDPVPAVLDLPRLCTHVLGWEPADLVASPEGLEVVLPSYEGDVLRPTHAVPDVDAGPDGTRPWLMLVQVVATATDLDALPAESAGRHWQASPQARFERLLREAQVPIGLLSNGTDLRLVYAPRGETSGHLTFPVRYMTAVAGRANFAALLMLLSADRLFSLPDNQRLPALLLNSRKYQNRVSTRLARQVLAALYELVRGLQAADDQRHGDLLRDVLRDDPDHAYAGLLTVLMRLVFLLYAEDRGLLSEDPTYVNHYSVTGLFERLREDAARHPDTMDQRFGAWAQLLTLFRLVHDGGRHGGFRLPARRGYLFDPDRYPFLEGRPRGERRAPGRQDPVPHIPDGVVARVLDNLLVLDGERLSYRSLDVEQIGSVYETMMGFGVEVARGPSIAIRPKKAQGAPTSINLDDLLASKPADRAKWLKERTDQELTGQALAGLKAAASIADLVASLDRKLDKAATPAVVPAGALVLQPSDERRKSGSHYTPRSLTEPIVRTTLRPVLERIGPRPTPEQVLDLKVCDPAMGSGAFLVEACRQLGEALVEAWHAHGRVPEVPADEDEILHARRLVAQQCLYGVDRNPMAVDLAKLSLWLATLARDHPFTFLDHALRHGDSLVGLSLEQVASFSIDGKGRTENLFRNQLRNKVANVRLLRAQIQQRDDDDRGGSYDSKARIQANIDQQTVDLRLAAARLLELAWNPPPKKEAGPQRNQALLDLDLLRSSDPDRDARVATELTRALRRIAPDRAKPVLPFHWEIEFPEVFDRTNPGFDAIVGNPPFMGGSKVSGNLGARFLDWLKLVHAESHGNADLVAHFFRRSFDLLRDGGAFGLIATNTIGQGDTRSTGLRWICLNGGTIYNARKRLKWPGLAAVVVSVVHAAKSGQAEADQRSHNPLLDGKLVRLITAYLFHAGGHEDPVRLKSNGDISFSGSKVYGQGFTFDDSDTKGVASSIADMHRLLNNNPNNANRIFPYIGGEEVNDSPTHLHSRYVINFEEMSETEARKWPDLMSLVETNVKPERARLSGNRDAEVRKERWWLWGRYTPALFRSIQGMDRMLVCSQTSKYLSFVFLSTKIVVSHKIIALASQSMGMFCTIQSRLHCDWADFLGSSMKDDPVYTPSDCFETFPFPPGYETNPALEEVGRAYYEFRADLMVRNDEGLTKTYNRFHDPEERSPDIVRLRELHAAMDRAVLDAYGWTDVPTACEFLLDYEEEDDEDDEPGARRRRKKPYRFRWPDEVRDDVLARLLALNAERAKMERLAGVDGDAPAKPGRKSAPRKKKADPNPPGLLPD